jgi:hypothetical protein
VKYPFLGINSGSRKCGATLPFTSGFLQRRSTCPVALQDGRPRGVDVGHQLVGRLVAAVGVIALGEDEIGGGEFLGGDRPDVDPEPLEKRECVVEEQLQPCPRLVKMRPAEIAVTPVKLNRKVTLLIGAPWQLKAPHQPNLISITKRNAVQGTFDKLSVCNLRRGFRGWLLLQVCVVKMTYIDK